MGPSNSTSAAGIGGQRGVCKGCGSCSGFCPSGAAQVAAFQKNRFLRNSTGIMDALDGRQSAPHRVIPEHPWNSMELEEEHGKL
jgi:ferredoxin